MLKLLVVSFVQRRNGLLSSIGLARIIHEGLSGAEFRVKIVCDLVVGVDWRIGSWGVDR